MIKKNLPKIIFLIFKIYIIIVHKRNINYLLMINLLLISLFDMKFNIIPNWIICSMGIDLIIYQKLSELLSNNFAFICLIALIFLIINALNKETFYGGDVKLILVLSLILGTKISYILLYSGVINVFLHIVTRKEKIPFAPSIFTAIIFFWGDHS